MLNSLLLDRHKMSRRLVAERLNWYLFDMLF